MNTKRQPLSINEKISLIRIIQKGEKKYIAGKRFGLSPSTVATIWKNKEKIIQAGLDGTTYKKLRRPKFVDLDQAVLTWCNRQRQNNMPISGPLIKDQAEIISRQLNIDGFKASEGWLGKFKKRHKIIYKKINEKRDVDTGTTDDWNNKPCIQVKEEAPSGIVYDDTNISFETTPDMCSEFNRDKLCTERVSVFVDSTAESHDQYLVSVTTEDSLKDEEKEEQVGDYKPPQNIQQALDAAKLLGEFLLFHEDDPTASEYMDKIYKKIKTKYWLSKKRQSNNHYTD